jgi:hypothetical protein
MSQDLSVGLAGAIPVRQGGDSLLGSERDGYSVLSVLTYTVWSWLIKIALRHGERQSCQSS